MGRNKTIGSQYRTNEVYTQNGLLYRDKVIIDLPEADFVAQEHGFVYAEDLVKHLEGLGKTSPPKNIQCNDIQNDEHENT